MHAGNIWHVTWRGTAWGGTHEEEGQGAGRSTAGTRPRQSEPDDPYNVLAAIAVATSSANPGHEETALKYLNESLIPYATAHKAQYVCLVSEVFYNSQSSTEELKGFAAAKHANGAVPIAFIEYAYFLIKTEPAREHLGLQMPGDNGVPEAIAAFKQTLNPKGGSLIPEGAVRLDCDHQQ